jgi:hypothetical protein
VQRERPLIIIIGATLGKELAPLRARVDLKAALANPPAAGKTDGH